MKKILAVLYISMMVVSVSIAGEFRCPIGLSYITGFNKVGDLYKDNLDAEGYVATTVTVIPVGLTLQPYVQFNQNVGIGVDVGPSMAIFGDRTFFSVPISVEGRYRFFPEASLSPYIKGGVSFQIASGDYVDSTSTGFKGALGLEFLKTKNHRFMVELATDTSEIKFDDEAAGYNRTKTIKPIETSISLLIQFK